MIKKIMSLICFSVVTFGLCADADAKPANSQSHHHHHRHHHRHRSSKPKTSFYIGAGLSSPPVVSTTTYVQPSPVVYNTYVPSRCIQSYYYPAESYYVQPAPVVYQSAPVVYQSAPVYHVAPTPSFNLGFLFRL